MASYSSLTVRTRVEQSTLDEEEPLANSRKSLNVSCAIVIWSFLKLVDKDSLRIHGWSQHQVSRLLFDLDVSERLHLVESVRQSDSEHSLPSYITGQVMMEFV